MLVIRLCLIAVFFSGLLGCTSTKDKPTLKNLAGETTRDNNKVRQVHNELKIQSNSTFFSRTNDNWIASKVRSKILMQKIESERVKVVVENRVVYLMGLLTREEAQSISELSASIKGVERVVRVFEYIQRI